MSQPTRFKIVRLESENIKRLSAVEIKPNGTLVEITGRNGQGKTSVLDSLFWALSGTKPIQSNPIRKGQQKAKIVLDLGTIIVRRNFTAQPDGGYTTSLTLENEDGMRYQREQSVLDAIVGQLTFDPLAFTRMSPDKQFDMLKGFVPDFDFATTLKANTADYEARTDVNRKIRELKGQSAGIMFPEDTPDVPVDEAALAEELQAAGEAIREQDAVRFELAKKQDRAHQDRHEAERLKGLAASLRSQADDAESQAEIFANRAEAAEAEIEAAPQLAEIADPAEIRERMTAARAINRDVAKKAERTQLARRIADLDAESAALTKSMEAREATKQAAIAAAKMPVEGIGFGDGIVLLNGLPFDQASSAEQLRASVALTMAANPRLRIVMIRDGSLLDDDSMKIIADMASANDIQVWVETVASSRSGAIVIEDGAIRPEVAEAAE